MCVQFLAVTNVSQSIPVYTNIMLYILIPNPTTAITVGRPTSRSLPLLCTNGQHTTTLSPLRKNKRLSLSHLQVRIAAFESLVWKERKKKRLDGICWGFCQGNYNIDKKLKYLIKIS